MTPPRARFATLLALSALLAGCASGPSDDGGQDGGEAALAFLSPQELPGTRGGPEPTIAFSPDGVAYVGAQDPVGGGPRVWISQDDGASWREVRPTTEGGGELSLAAGPDGSVYVTQLGTRGNIVSVSRDHGESWASSPIGSVTQYFDRQWAAVDGGGRAYLLARDFQQGSASVSRSDDRGLTWVPRGRAWDAGHEPGSGNGNLVAANGRLYLPYVCRELSAVCVAVSEDRGESWTQHVAVERAARVDNVYPALAAAPDALVLTWSDATGGRLAVWAAESGDHGRSWSAAARVSGADESATLPWVAADAERAVVAYLATPLDLAAADGADAADAAWTPRAVVVGEGATPRASPVDVTPRPVHVGVISKPVGRPGQDAPYDRSFGDFFTAAFDGDGRLFVAVSRDEGSPESTRDLVVRERR